MTDIYSISSAQVNTEEVRMTLKSLPDSESVKESVDINFSYNREHWTLIRDDSKWFPVAVRDSLHKIQDD